MQTVPVVDEFLEKYDYDVLNDVLIYTSDIVKPLNISRTTLIRWIKANEFPQPNFFLCGRPVWTLRRFKAYLQQCVDKTNK